MEIKGTIIAALPETSGVSKAGNQWKKKEYVLENTDSQYPRKVAFTCFGDNADKINLQVGQVATVYFDIESREYNGRWYTDLRAWRADVEVPGAAVQFRLLLPCQPAATRSSPSDNSITALAAAYTSPAGSSSLLPASVDIYG